VSLPEDLVDVLLPLVAGKAPDALLFTSTLGNQLSSSRFWTTTWTPALDAAGNPVRADGAPDPITVVLATGVRSRRRSVPHRSPGPASRRERIPVNRRPPVTRRRLL